MALEYATILATALPSLEAVDRLGSMKRWNAPAHRPVARASAGAWRAVPPDRRSSRTAQGQGPGDAGPASSSGWARCPMGRAIEFSQSYYRGDTYGLRRRVERLDMSAVASQIGRGHSHVPRRPPAASDAPCGAQVAV